MSAPRPHFLSTMTTLLQIIQHLFPRKQWTEVATISYYDNATGHGIPSCRVYVLQDQFGNRKTFRA